MEIPETNEGKLDYFKQYITDIVRSMFKDVDSKGFKKLSRDLAKFNTPCLNDLNIGYHWVTDSRGLMDIDNGKQTVPFHGLINRVACGCEQRDIRSVKSACGIPGERSYLGVEIKHKNYYVDQNWNWVQIKGFFEDLLIAGVITHMRNKVIKDQPIVMSEFVKHLNKPLGEVQAIMLELTTMYKRK